MRTRLKRWTSDVLPGRRVAAFIDFASHVSSSAPPRVAAACLRTAFNGWCTGRRFQQRGCCVLGCPLAADSLEHYFRCPRYRVFLGRHLGLRGRDGAAGFDAFFGWRRGLALESGEGADTAGLAALGMYSLYRVHGAVRSGTLQRRDAVDALPASLREGARGHPKAEALLRAARVRRRAW